MDFDETSVNMEDFAEPLDSDVADIGDDAEFTEQQSAEENAKYAAARRKAEVETSAKYQARQDRLAQASGFDSFEAFESAVQAENQARKQHEQESRRQAYISETGIDPDALQSLINEALKENPILKEAKHIKNSAVVERAIKDLVRDVPECSYKGLADFDTDPKFEEIKALIFKGADLAEAYKIVHLDEIIEAKAKGRHGSAPSTGSAKSTGATSNDTYFSKAQVQKMSPDEVGRNLDAINRSRVKW